eukprot:NODE_447_length_8464_cov_0.381112.p2 type:complete len:441 gc:universal NODE_447_length_8464_cov_0.381112:6363-7685(+)
MNKNKNRKNNNYNPNRSNTRNDNRSYSSYQSNSSRLPVRQNDSNPVYYEDEPQPQYQPEHIQRPTSQRYYEDPQNYHNYSNNSYQNYSRNNDNPYRNNDNSYRNNDNPYRSNDNSYRSNDNSYRNNDNSYRNNDNSYRNNDNRHNQQNKRLNNNLYSNRSYQPASNYQSNNYQSSEPKRNYYEEPPSNYNDEIKQKPKNVPKFNNKPKKFKAFNINKKLSDNTVVEQPEKTINNKNSNKRSIVTESPIFKKQKVLLTEAVKCQALKEQVLESQEYNPLTELDVIIKNDSKVTPKSPEVSPVTIEESANAFGKKYKRELCIGQGRYGQVWKAHSTVAMDIKIALKRTSRNNGQIPTTTIREAKFLMQLDNINICKQHEIGAGTSSIYTVLDYCNFDLVGLVHVMGGDMDSNVIKNLAHQLLKGISYLHSKDIIHRVIGSLI